MRSMIGVDPLRAVSEVYEEVYAAVKSSLTGADKEEFIQLCPNMNSMERNLYRLVSWHQRHLPSTHFFLCENAFSQ